MEESSLVLNKLLYDQSSNTYSATRKPFCEDGSISSDARNQCLSFAYNMTYGEKGEHRERRINSSVFRSNNQIFINAFQGKIAEFAVCDQLASKLEIKQKNGVLGISNPDMSMSGRGSWDSGDLILLGHKMSVKSSKSFARLLLLEKTDWDKEGRYIPDLITNKNDEDAGNFDFFIMVRVSCDNIMKELHPALYKNDKNNLLNVFNKIKKDNISITYDIPGFVTKKDIVQAIRKNNILFHDQMLGMTIMEVDNYYIQVADMRDISELKEFLPELNSDLSL